MARAKRIGAVAAIDIVESAYRLEGNEVGWLEGLLERVAPDLDTGLGVYAFTGDESLPDLARSPAFAQRELSVRFMERVAALNAEAPNALFDVLNRQLVTCGGLEQVLGAGSPIVEHFRGLMAPVGIVDGFCMFAQDTRGGSVTVSAPASSVVEPSPRVRGIWRRVGLHVVAGLRLRRRLARSLVPHDALLAPSGGVQDASADLAEDNAAQRALTHAVRAMEEARRRTVRVVPEQALQLWQGLVAGRWSLVDHWERDGRRYIAAYANPPGLHDPRALTLTEQRVLSYLAFGAANKEISYALGLPEKTVAACVSRILKKLRVKTRVDLAALAGAPNATRFDVGDSESGVSVMAVERAPVGAVLARLSAAEREISDYVARGWTNARIATKRGVAPSTVAKQLQAIYDKVGVDSRARLAKMVADGG